MSKLLSLLIPLLLLAYLKYAVAITSLPSEYHRLPSLREQHRIISGEWLPQKHNVVQSVMAKYSVDMWIISQREYGEDTVFWSLIDRSVSFSARRRTTLVFYYNPTNTSSFQSWYMIDNTPTLWSDLRSIVNSNNPKNIALNIDDDMAFADGLHAGEREILERELAPYANRIVRRPGLAVDFVATRVDGQLKVYKKLTENVHAMIDEAFSSKVITPGVTTVEDVVWFFRDRIQSLNYTTWFHPSVDVTRRNPSGDKAIQLSGDAVILPGDVLWCDVGVTAMGLNTDTQHMGYVLREGEVDPPRDLQDGLRLHSNVMQDILMREIKVGRTGNEILKISLDLMKSSGVEGTIYCHPIGDWGHAAGALIGMTNLQDGVPVKGDLKVIDNMWFSIELQASVPIASWGNQRVSFRQEEDMAVIDGVPTWVYRRQDTLHVVRPTTATQAAAKPLLIVQQLR
ncbi:xaa-Pro aminopeptidase family enzyme [Cladochytrium replicatum]|nr:xaa-Pro aminopeptidase family enzyme [Cladochytrium replicatum]